jgi:hypothetical protein
MNNDCSKLSIGRSTPFAAVTLLQRSAVVYFPALAIPQLGQKGVLREPENIPLSSPLPDLNCIFSTEIKIVPAEWWSMGLRRWPPKLVHQGHPTLPPALLSTNAGYSSAARIPESSVSDGIIDRLIVRATQVAAVANVVAQS